MAYKEGNKYRVLKGMSVKDENGEIVRHQNIGEIYEGNPSFAQYPASLELMKEEDKKTKRGKQNGSN